MRCSSSTTKILILSVSILGQKSENSLQCSLQRAESKCEAGIRILPTEAFEGKAIKLMAWTWPGIKQVQTMLRHQVMQAMVDGHVHEPPTEIHADAISSQQVA